MRLRNRNVQSENMKCKYIGWIVRLANPLIEKLYMTNVKVVCVGVQFLERAIVWRATMYKNGVPHCKRQEKVENQYFARIIKGHQSDKEPRDNYLKIY